jgi:hypothetical protein
MFDQRERLWKRHMGMVALQPAKEVATRAVDRLLAAVHNNIHDLQDPVDPNLVLAQTG